MGDSKYQRYLLSLPLLVIFTFSSPCVYAQTFKERLEQQTDFMPQNSFPAEQLIEVARRFKLPMAIEWLEQTKEQAKPQLTFKGGSVLDLIEAIVRQSSEHQLLIEDRILYVCPPAVVSHPFNFLNLRITNYSVKDESLFGAEAALRTSINMMLYPELYKNGYGGGYGGGYPDVFWQKNITFSGHDLTIREILTGIAEESGNAFWIVKLKPEELIGDKPKWIGVPINKYGHSPINSRWQFIPLSEERSNNSAEVDKSRSF
ncbi:MAG TPA: hypothetical protein VIG25_09285 [Pyrinomonadaceae bacterium]|jgi:hypothetical protein